MLILCAFSDIVELMGGTYGRTYMIRIADTYNGKVRGIAADDPRVTVFKGIPFAKPPVGELRWKAPEPPESWEGVRDCTEFAPISMQDIPGVGDDLYAREFHVDSAIAISEDSLYLNVWTGAKDPGEKLPVLVWIYGGAFQWGYTSEMEFNGERLARHGIVVVSMAYRLGVFGYLAHPDLDAEDPAHSSNFGLLDQQAAIKWVYENIEAFGGDAQNITLAGQSAGGASVMYALSNDANVHMIKKATVFSGFIRNPFYEDSIIMPRRIEQVRENGKDFIEYLGCGSIEEARGLDAEKIRDAYWEYAKDHPRFVPCIDGAYVKEDPFELMLKGELCDIPLFAGYTKDEFTDKLPARADMSETDILADVFEKGGIRYTNIVQDSVRKVARAHAVNNSKSPMFTYRFAPSVPGDDNPGVFHSCDLWFFFETIQKCHRPFNGMHYALARRMCDYWSNFIRTGDPNGKGYDGADLPVWEKVSDADDFKYEMIFTEK